MVWSELDSLGTVALGSVIGNACSRRFRIRDQVFRVLRRNGPILIGVTRLLIAIRTYAVS